MWTREEELARAKRWLDMFRPLPADVNAELRHRFEVRLAHHSTAIEGNTLTQSETQIVIEKGITIAGKSVTEHLEIIGHQEALGFVYELATQDEPIGEWEIRQIHSLVMKGQGNGDVGAYRTLDVMAAGTEFRYPSWIEVPYRMESFSSMLRTGGPVPPIMFAIVAHLQFVTIHPFRDGNGRVARLLMNLLLLRAGYPIAVIPVERRAEYIDALVEAQTKANDKPFHEIVYDAVEISLRETLQLCLTAGSSRAIPEDAGSELRSWLSRQ